MRMPVAQLALLLALSTVALASDAKPWIDLSNMPSHYVVAAGEPVYCVTPGITDHDVVICSALDTSVEPWKQVEGFKLVMGAYRGGLRFVSGEDMKRLVPGQYVLRMSVVGSELTADHVLTVRGPSPLPPDDVERIEISEEEELAEEPVEPETPQEPKLPEAPKAAEPEPTPPATVVPFDPSQIGGSATGFVEYKPQSDSQVHYVPSGGSIYAAYDKLRDGYPDFIVLQAGGSYDISSPIKWTKSGRSASAPMVLGVMGDGPRPVVRTRGQGFLQANDGTIRHLVFDGLEIIATRRDPDSKDFNGGGTYENAFNISSPAVGITFQDCDIRYFTFGMVIDDWRDHGGTARIRDVTLRRCIVRDSYSFGGDHSSGLFMTEIENLTLDGCIFDHNGWSERVSSSKRIGFNHNIYLMNCRNVIVRNSIFARESFLSLKVRSGQWADGANGKTQNLLIQDNLFLETLLPLGINDNIASGDVTAEDVQVIGNVILRTGGMLQGTPMGVGMSIMKIARLKLDRNIFTDKGVADGSLLVKPAVELKQATTLRDIQIRGNVVQWPAINYYTGQPIHLISREAGQAITSSQVTLSGNLTNAAPSLFPDAKRGIEGYDKAIGGNGTPASFLYKAVRQQRQQSDPRYTAGGVIEYIRKGFNVSNN